MSPNEPTNWEAQRMIHHEYQIYYGGFKKVLQQAKYCEDCRAIIIPDNTNIKKITRSHLQHLKGVLSHKKQSAHRCTSKCKCGVGIHKNDG